MFRIDTSDPRFLIIYGGDEHAVPDDYRNWGAAWIERLNRGERFGVIFVDEPHEHNHDEEDEQRHREHEAEITRLTNDFRRDYRHLTATLNVGYARVMLPEWIPLYYSAPGDWERALEHNNMFAQYNWGIPGGGFTELDKAKVWLIEQFDRATTTETAVPATQLTTDTVQKVGLFYGSSTGITEYVASKIQGAWQAAGLEALEAINIGQVKNLTRLLAFDNLILGIPTWNIGQLQDDWDILFPQLDMLDFSGKKVALFGVGDQYGYPDNFLDAVGILGNKLIERGTTLIGRWYDEHYEFAASIAFVDGKFMGLGIDEDHQANLTNSRIQQWITQISMEFAPQSKSVSKG
jgi:flavodoxin I